MTTTVTAHRAHHDARHDAPGGDRGGARALAGVGRSPVHAGQGTPPGEVSSCWGDHAAALADRLTAAGVITDVRWAEAFARVPRHRFTGHLVVDDTDPGCLRAAYHDPALAPGPGGSAAAGGPAMPGAPSVIASALSHVDLDAALARGGRVLQTDVGTGYTTALLCAALGEGYRDRLVTASADAAHAELARRRLASCGLRPQITVAARALEHGPYTVILGDAIPALPREWISALAPGGTVIAPWATLLAPSVAVLHPTTTRTGAGSPPSAATQVSGHLHPLPAPAGGILASSTGTGADGRGGERRGEVAVRPAVDAAPLDTPGMRALLAALDPTLRPPQRAGRVRWSSRDGSWADLVVLRERPARAGHGPARAPMVVRVAEAGPRRLWPLLAYAIEQWERHDRPGPGRFGVTTAGGCHRVWLDHPGRVIPAPEQGR